MVGFSMGLGLKVSKFHIAYGRSTYHLAGATNHFSLTTSLSEFYRK
jgi:predicted Na+-dependent transporter